MTTKEKMHQKARNEKQPPSGDSPITVGGGGGIDPWVELGFDHDEFVPEPDDRDRFVNPDLSLAFIQINNGNPQQLPTASEIVVEFAKGNVRRRIIMSADPPNGIRLGVEFKANELRYNHQRRKHRDDGSRLTMLTINGAPTALGTNDQVSVHTA